MLKRSFLTSIGHQGVFAVSGSNTRVVAKNNVHFAIQDVESGKPTVTALSPSVLRTSESRTGLPASRGIVHEPPALPPDRVRDDGFIPANRTKKLATSIAPGVS
jgi:hypothetical protein